MNIRKALSESIQTGFVDQLIQSNKAYRPELLTNNREQGKKVLSTILRELEQCEEFWFSVAFVTTSGIATLMNTLIELEKKNIKGKILASQYLNFTQPEALRRIKQFKNIELRIATEGAFHSKGYLFRKGNVFDLIIGSSNLTQTALSSNKEWNLKISATDDSELIGVAVEEFKTEFDAAQVVTDKYLIEYDLLWRARTQFEREIKEKRQTFEDVKITPNVMQQEALANIEHLRANGKTKALLISATGTGKTYLSAFDVQKFKPKKFLFIVHRLTIAEEAMKTFKSLLGADIKMGIYSGKRQQLEADYLFSTIQTISKQEHLDKFDPNYFEYIVIDESHHATAESYQRILNHFKPNFLLGMTATPERTNGDDIFKLFDHNIAYEIRLHRALAEGMLSPFHYYGVTDLTINDQEIDELTGFNLLTAKERVARIIETAEQYGSDDGNVRGLIFCSKNEISIQLSKEFNDRGYQTVALTGASSEDERQRAIRLLESENKAEKLDYIFTVDIFNEGIDIPSVNQIIMLRPTQSAIIFVQQLGRGLRKIGKKDYLTVIDFIGNYNNNYLVPIALYGDTSYNKDALRKLIASGSSLIPGASTINFDRISKEKIFAAIDSANMQLKKDLTKDYNLLKYKLGRIPMMVDFLEHGSRDPQLYVNYSKSYFNFVSGQEDELKGRINETQKKLLELFSNEINNAKRIEETLLLKGLIEIGTVDLDDFKAIVKQKYGSIVSDATLDSCVLNLNFEFVRENKDKKLKSAREIYDLNIVRKEANKLIITHDFQALLEQADFKEFLLDSIAYAGKTYDAKYNSAKFVGGFELYQKYTRKDVFRILNWNQNPLAQNVGGYIIAKDKSNCPIFVNYHKDESISSTTKYEDGFVSPSKFEWMSKSRRTLKSNDVQAIRNYKSGLRLPLFIKKSNDEGTEFYFMGDITPIDESFEETRMKGDNGKEVSVVKISFKMNSVVEDTIYEYLTHA
ncbi:MAG: superfamily II DNA or RNA helicase/HKD family nuclease [Crocinitomicaceae bacterium]|jgi:superfamily II DNA or RNA helicase/HKD family nuclease